jgi:hypothetical protein
MPDADCTGTAEHPFDNVFRKNTVLPRVTGSAVHYCLMPLDPKAPIQITQVSLLDIHHL